MLLSVSIFYSFLYSPHTRAADSIIFRLFVVSSSECFNGIDDDSDGLLDTSDPDCFGPGDNQESPFRDPVIDDFLIAFPGAINITYSDILGTYIYFRVEE